MTRRADPTGARPYVRGDAVINRVTTKTGIVIGGAHVKRRYHHSPISHSRRPSWLHEKRHAIAHLASWVALVFVGCYTYLTA